MGPSQVKAQGVQRSEHQRMGNYKLMVDPECSDRKLMEVACAVGSASQIKHWSQQLKQILSVGKSSNSGNFLPSKYHLVQEGMCGTSGILYMTFDYYPYILSEEIKSRARLNTPFSEEQIWYLLFEMVCVSKDFQKMGTKSGDIRPRNVVINENGQIKIVTRCSFPDELPNYSKALEMKQPGYLSPEQLTQIEKGVVIPQSDPILAQTFSIGMTIIDAALLFDSETLYDMHYIRFKAHIFNENVYKWKNLGYSAFLIKTVENMVEVSHVERPTPGEVYAIILPYEEVIRNLDPFVPDKEKSRLSLENYQKNMQNKSHFSQTRDTKPLGSRSLAGSMAAENKTSKMIAQNIKFPQVQQLQSKQIRANLQKHSVVPNFKPYLYEQDLVSQKSPKISNYVKQ